LTPAQEKEILASLKTMAYSLEYVLRYMHLIATRLEIPVVTPPQHPILRP